MGALIKGLLKRIFNWQDPKAWGSVLVLIASLAVKYLPFGSEIVGFVKDNPEEFISAAGAIAGALGLWNQKQKKAAIDQAVEDNRVTDGVE